MKNLTSYFKLLSDETRLRIMILLFHSEFCVCQLTKITGISQPNVSKHLARLKDMGLVKDQRKEQYSFYSIDIKDKLFERILESIVGNIEDYPTLKKDIARSKYANEYIVQTNKHKKLKED